MLNMISECEGWLLGVHIVGGPATELIHIGQMALIHGAHIDTFIDNVFNFPTFAEGYRIAALQISGQLAQGRVDVRTEVA
jgi:NAD(P) transhydrogenase